MAIVIHTQYSTMYIKFTGNLYIIFTHVTPDPEINARIRTERTDGRTDGRRQSESPSALPKKLLIYLISLPIRLNSFFSGV